MSKKIICFPHNGPKILSLNIFKIYVICQDKLTLTYVLAKTNILNMFKERILGLLWVGVYKVPISAGKWRGNKKGYWGKKFDKFTRSCSPLR